MNESGLKIVYAHMKSGITAKMCSELLHTGTVKWGSPQYDVSNYRLCAQNES